ncbi:MAG: Na/Pi cotransporter family protein [Roseburia sp.]|nr:Na/Pi cotransporter family protein [Roseburia sp.]
MEVILSILAGVGLFLYGMNLMSDGLQKVAGQKMRDVLEKLTKSSIMGLLLGIIFTGIIQSSNATTVLVVSFVNSGIMKLSQSVGVIMGANIGTTVTGQLISFKLDAIAPFFIIAGVILVMFIKKPMAKRIGEVVLGFGILFFGMSTLSSSVKHLNQFAAVKTLFGSVTNPFLAVLIGFVLTSILQSASASVGILIVLASSGLIHPDICYYIIMGCDIGACGSAVLSSLGGNKDAKRAALIHLSFNVIGTVIVMILLAVAGNPIRSAIHGLTASIADTGLRAGRDVANINSILKVSQVIILFPFSKYLIKLTRWIVKGEDEEVHGLELKYIGNHSIFNVTTALPQAIHETERMGTMAVNNLKRSMKALMEKDEEALEEVYKKEEVIDFLNTEISNYLVRANQLSLPIQDRKELGAMFHVVNDIERIGDHAENIADFAKTMRKADLQFSKKATNELMELYEKVCTLLEFSIKKFVSGDETHAIEIMQLEDEIDKMEKKFQKKHVNRLANNKCEPHAAMIFSDLLSNLERVADHGVNIAFAEQDEEEV